MGADDDTRPTSIHDREAGYEERRQQEHDNKMARLRMQNAHYVKEAQAREVADLAIRAIEAFIKGEAFLEIVPGNVGTLVRFVMPQGDVDGEQAASGKDAGS